MRRIIIAFLSFISISAGAQQTPSVRAYLENRKAEKLLKEQKYSEAREHLLGANKADPNNMEILLNLGLAYEALESYDQALAAYSTVEKLSDDIALKFMASFNSGQLKARMKKIDEALSDYQRALSYNSISIETKTNIELLMQSQQQKGEGGGEQEEKKDEEGQGKDKNQQEPQEFKQNQKQQRKFESKELSEDDVRKILGELKAQEQKIRAEFDKEKKKSQEQPNDKDW